MTSLPRHDLSVRGNIALKRLRIFVINVRHIVDAKSAVVFLLHFFLAAAAGFCIHI